ncbi:hypothetical protein ACOSQ3_007383 [Xanthoceras sorbifolium]
MTFSKVSLFRYTSLFSLLPPLPRLRTLSCTYYFMFYMDDPIHRERFNHDISRDLQVNAAAFQQKGSRDLDYFLMLDVEGEIEVLHFFRLMKKELMNTFQIDLQIVSIVIASPLGWSRDTRKSDVDFTKRNIILKDDILNNLR